MENEYYILKSTGRKIPFGKPLSDLDLQKEEILELYGTTANLMEIWRIRKNIYDLRGDVRGLTETNEKILKRLDDLKDNLRKHNDYCPINKPGVEEIAQRAIEKIKIEGSPERTIISDAVSDMITDKIDKAIDRQTRFMKWLALLVTTLAGIGYLVFLLTADGKLK